jgi:hypothetical protein
VLPPLAGRPIRVEIRRSLGAYHAATSIPRRKILLDAGVLARRGEFERILVHELFHFVWVRLSNPARRDWEELLRAEIRSGLAGELGWSAEWRKSGLPAAAPQLRPPRWRRYACESFCDTAAWLWAGTASHDEFTLPSRARNWRRRWFQLQFPPDAALFL